MQNDDYKFKVEKGLGSLTVNGNSYSEDFEVGEGTNIIDIDGGVGSIIINTNK